jgi:membrane-associated phospholipid phosphatase
MILGRPLFDHLKRVGGWLLSGLVVLACYGAAKLAGPHHLLPLGALDRAVPLLPWTIWIYGSGSKAALFGWLSVPDSRAGKRLLLTLSFCAVVCGAVFFAWPTTYPRDLYPLPGGDSATLREFASLREADSPTNCFPSLHVALAWGLALSWSGWLCAARPRSPASGAVTAPTAPGPGGPGPSPTAVVRAWRHASWTLPLAWAVAVSIGTLTTKQHYLVDVPAGFAVGVASFALAGRLFSGAPRPALRLALADPRAAEALLARVQAHQWRLDDLDWPRTPPLPPLLARLLNEVVYIEEIARLNFELLRDASDTPALRALYGLFADEERRHADGLRRVLAAAGAPLEPPGLGNALVLDQFDTLSAADAALVAVSTPVFETFLDAGTIPFLRAHPALRSPAFEAFVERVCTDEGAHLALNWIVTRDLGRRQGGLAGLSLLANPNLLRGMAAVPWMSLEVYAVAHSLGYDFATLLPPFGRLWRLHDRFPELARFPLWWPYRVFVAAGAIATVTCVTLVRARLLFGGVWVGVTRVTGVAARLLFGDALLRRRKLPAVP